MTVGFVPSELLARAGPGRIAAAEDYLVDERVQGPVRYGRHLAATIRGFTDRYRTRVTVGAEPSGSCPCGRRAPGGLCPHALAVALLYAREPDRFVNLAAAFAAHELRPRSERESAWAEAVLAGAVDAPSPPGTGADPETGLSGVRNRLGKLGGWAAVSALADVAGRLPTPAEEPAWLDLVTATATRLCAAPPAFEPGCLARIAPLMTLALADDHGVADALHSVVVCLCRGGGEAWLEDALSGALGEAAARARMDPARPSSQARLGRLLAWHVRWLEHEGRWAHAVEVVRRYSWAPGALRLQVQALVALGREAEARTRVQSARVSFAERQAARQALGGPAPLPWGQFFRDPSPETLAALLDAAPADERDDVQGHALNLLRGSGAADALTRIGLAGHGVWDLVHWAQRARPALKARMGLELIERDPAAALALLEAACREGEGDVGFPRARVRRARAALHARLDRPEFQEDRDGR